MRQRIEVHDRKLLYLVIRAISKYDRDTSALSLLVLTLPLWWQSVEDREIGTCLGTIEDLWNGFRANTIEECL